MRSKSGPQSSAEEHVREIRRATRKQYSSEEKIRIVLEGLRGEYSIAELCRREAIVQSLYYGHGRNAGFPAPPAQIPACAANAPGSSLGFWRQSGDRAVDVECGLAG